MESTIIEQIYNMLSLKNKKKLFDDWGADCATDLESRIKAEFDSDDCFKIEIKKEILDILDNQIETEIDAMKNNYTVAEIAREVLLDVKNSVVII